MEQSPETDGLWLGDSSMLNTGEFPNVENVSRLSQILEDNVPQKYYLSARACQGILTRASRRGKPLPELLEQALLGMIEYLEPGTLPQVKQKVKEQEGRFEKELDEYWNQTILQQYWELVKSLPDEYPFWMPMPELPEMLDRINKGLHT